MYPSRVYDHGEGKRGLFPTPMDEDIVPGTNYAMYYDLGVYGIPKPVRQVRPCLMLSGSHGAKHHVNRWLARE